MKTSNKLLLIFSILMLASAVVAMSMVRKNLIIIDEELIELSGDVQTKTLLDSIDKTSFEFFGMQHVTLDPTFEGLTVSADKVIIEDIGINNGESIELSYASHVNRGLRKDINIVVGVKGLEMVSILAKNNAIVKSANPLVLSALNIKAAHSADLEINADVQFLNIEAEDDSKLNLMGSAHAAYVDSWNNGDVNLVKTDIEMLNLKLSQDARLKVGSCNLMSGRMNDNSGAEFSGPKPQGMIESRHSSYISYNKGSN